MALCRASVARYAAVWTLAALASTTFGCTSETSETSEDDGFETAEHALERPNAHILPFSHQVQETRHWCGPAATRMALSSSVAPPSQQQIAWDLGTTEAGTNNIGLVTRVMNKYIGGYETRWMPNDPPRPAQKAALWTDIVRSIDSGHSVVANIVAPPSNNPWFYPDNRTVFHYIALVGYNAETSEIFVADSANFQNVKTFWISLAHLSTLIPPKGYSAYFPKGTTCAGGKGTVVGKIEQKYLALGGCNGFLGAPTMDEGPASNGGRYIHFERGSIYWSQATGAFEVHGDIRDAWKNLGWDHSFLGYPVSDEHEVPGGRQSDFEGGTITWNAETRETTVSKH